MSDSEWIAALLGDNADDITARLDVSPKSGVIENLDMVEESVVAIVQASV